MTGTPAVPRDRLGSGRPVVVFFFLATAISWAAWIPYAASQAGRLAWAVPAELIWLSEYGPSVAAIILTAVTEGRAGVGRLLRPLLRWRVEARWYAAALLVTPLLASLAIGLQAGLLDWNPELSRLADWDARFRERTAQFSPSIGLISSLVSFMASGAWQTGLALATLAITNGGLSEEIGWRGYALPRLQRAHGPLVASLVVGLLWGLWHTGTGFWQVMLTSDPGAALGFALKYLAQYLMLVTPLSVVYTWIYNGTGGSLLVIVLLHAAYNITVTIVNSNLPGFRLGLFVGLFWILAAGLIVAPRAGFRTSRARLRAGSPAER